MIIVELNEKKKEKKERQNKALQRHVKYLVMVYY